MKLETEFKETELGMIPSDWEIKELGEMCKFQYGLGESAEDSGKYIYIRITDIDSNGFLIRNNLKYINENKVTEKYILNKNDVLVARTGASYGKTYIFKEAFEATYGGFLIKFLFDDCLNSEYYFQFARSEMYWNQANNLVNGGAQPQFNANTISKLLVPIPPLQEQKAIAKILSDLDEKIEINRKINENLEELGQTLFKRWFIDFEFPNEKGEPYKSSGGEMIESELGEIPKGWRVDKLGNHIKFIKGKKPISTSNEKEENYLQQILIDTFNGGVKIYADKTNTIIVDIENILMVMDGASSGRVEIGYKGILGSTLAKINVDDRLNYYTYFYLKNKEQEINTNTTGTSIPHTDKGRINNFIIFISNKELYFKFNKEVNPIINKIINSKKEIQSLQQIRDSLLPKLMSGQIRVK